jgi:uncharacterized iron-regulated membrane protein
VKLRSIVFWLHLVCGSVAGAVIFIMSVTGVLLTYQRQITAWADARGYDVDPAPQRLAVDTLISKATESRPDLSVSAIAIRSDATEPASLTVGAGRQVFVNPYTGEVLGEGNGQIVRAFFRRVVEWHRYLAASGTSRPFGRAVTGAANLAFLFIVFSGLFLWWPRAWTRQSIRNVTWFKGGLRGRPRDFNWHNTIGFWSAVPLAIIVAGGVVISYPWAGALVYRAYGEEPPPSNRPSGGTQPHGSEALRPAEGLPLEAAIDAAVTRMPEWKTISVSVPPLNAPRVVVTLDAGNGGQPHKRATLAIDRRTGVIAVWEPFSHQSSGRKARMWLRFAHTGEVYGLAGQTVAGVATAAAAVLVWTGLALALRRLLAWRKRSRVALPRAA